MTAKATYGIDLVRKSSARKRGSPACPHQGGGEVTSYSCCWEKYPFVLSSSRDREAPSLGPEKQIPGLYHHRGLFSNLEIVHFLVMWARK